MWPIAPIDRRTSLATALQASPGVYALLLGSGLSRAAGIPTGWEVVRTLIRRVAACEGIDDPDVQDRPEAWWTSRFGVEPGYDTVLDALAPSDAARQALLRPFFDPVIEGTRIEPTAAHHAIAELVRDGTIRVILTTNFDRLTERALDAVGVSPHVISAPAQERGMLPLQHSPVTVVKLHGDYAGLGLRNTPTELDAYPAPWRRILRRVFDEYGLLISGWSADYDKALTQELVATRSRRYPVFWTALGGELSEVGQRVATQRGAFQIPIDGADEFFVDMSRRLARLRAMARRQVGLRLSGDSIDTPQGVPSPAWSYYPLLWLRASFQITASANDVDPFDPVLRETVAAQLMNSRLGSAIHTLETDTTPTSAIEESRPDLAPPSTEVLRAWTVPPGSRTTTSRLQLGYGHDASRGIGALLTVNAPSFSSGALTCALDLGISVRERLPLTTIASLLRDMVDALQLVRIALAEVTPTDSSAGLLRITLHADGNDGQGRSRPNDMRDRIDFATAGERSTDGAIYTTGIRLHDGLDIQEIDIGALVSSGLYRMLLDSDFVDPREAYRDVQSVTD